ncbi:MAG: polysaccharide deacetylase family protein [Candidatus Riflebacteria bacterium]|nr:polysaccharide deacetylase family protein [Candidatus Riflebacteria bacterium]
MSNHKSSPVHYRNKVPAIERHLNYGRLFRWHFFSACLLLCIVLLSGPASLYAQDFDSMNPPDLMKDFEALRQRIRQNPRDVAALNSLGIIYAQAGKLDDATRLWRYALGIDPNYIHLYNNLGSALKQLGRKDEARIIFRTGLTRSSSYWIYYNLGLLEKEGSNLPVAATCFKSCLQQHPGFEPALKQLAELGYHVQLPATKAARPLSLGSYKPPVETGNIDFYPLYPDGVETQPSGKTWSSGSNYAAKPSRSTTITPFTPLSLADCDQIIKTFKADPKDRFIALTFDDGPHHTLTREILDILGREGAKGTFFVVGNRAETYPDILTRMIAEGHDVGNHSWEHNSLTKSSRPQALQSLQRTNELISGITGKACLIVRPPFGQTNQSVKGLIHGQGWHEIMWDSDSRDWENKNPDRILSRVMRSVSPGSIVLFHDIHPGAAQMLPTLIKAFKANGYRFITISELIAIRSAS